METIHVNIEESAYRELASLDQNGDIGPVVKNGFGLTKLVIEENAKGNEVYIVKVPWYFRWFPFLKRHFFDPERHIVSQVVLPSSA